MKLYYKFGTAFLNPQIVQLSNRAIIGLSGKDAQSVLQGISTNDTLKFVNSTSQQAQYAAFLNVQGRIEFDAIIIKPQIMKDGRWQFHTEELLLDIDKEQKKETINYIKKYLFRKQVELFDMELFTLGFYSDIIRNKEELGEFLDQGEGESEEGDYRNMVYVDPRSDLLGLRIVTNDPDGIEIDQDLIKKAELDNYKAFRYSKGVLEGKEVQGKVPFVANVDYHNGLSLNKGCYIGQELTARSWHTGVIRKRCLPFMITRNQEEVFLIELDRSFKEDLVGKEVKTQDGKVIGRVLNHQNNYGVAVINYLEVQLSGLFNIGEYTARIPVRQTIQEKIEDYKKNILEKQKQEE